MNTLTRWSFLITLILAFILGIHSDAAADGGPCYLNVVGVDAGAFPTVSLVLRAQQATGGSVRGLENDIRVVEKTELTESDLLQPAVTRDDTVPYPVAISLIIDVRNGTSVEELTAIRQFALNIVDSFNAYTPFDAPNASQIALWVPSLDANKPVIAWGQGSYIDYARVINQEVLPVFDETSSGLDTLLRQLIFQEAPNDLPHIIIVDGKVAGVNESMDPVLLSTQAQQNNVLIYTAGLPDIDDTFLQKVTNTFYSPIDAGSEQIASDIANRYFGIYQLTYTSPLTPTPQERQVSISLTGSHSCNQTTTTFSVPNALPLPESSSQRVRYIFIGLGTLGLLGVLLIFEGIRQLRL